jgi:tetratricopeptide (TPR) repeat protein
VAEIVAALRAHEYPRARQLSEAALKQNPRDARLWTLRGLALSHMRAEEDAIGSYRHALEIDPDYVPALEGAAELLYAKRSQDAVGLLERLQKLHPGDETSEGMLAVLAFDRGDCPEAVRYFERSRDLIAKQKTALEEAGACLLKLNRTAQAVPVFAQILQLQPKDNNSRYNLAVTESLAGRYQDVITTLTPLTEVSKTDADALGLMSEAYEALSNTPKAVEYLRRAIEANPRAARYYVDFADLALTHESYRVGVDMVDFGLKYLPDRAALYLARGILYAQLGRYDDSERDFARADALDPHARGVSAAEGMVALQQNNLEQAERTLRERIRREPGNAFLYYLLAETLSRKGAAIGSAEFRDALQAASKAVMLQPEFPLARDLLGRLYLQEGKTEEAIEQSRDAVRENPRDQTAVYHLILALRKGNQAAEVQVLLKQLTALRAQARQKENEQRRYALAEPGNASETR